VIFSLGSHLNTSPKVVAIIPQTPSSVAVMSKPKPLWFGQNFRHSKTKSFDEINNNSGHESFSKDSISSTFSILKSHLFYQLQSLLPEHTEDPEYYYHPDYHSGLLAKYLQLTWIAREIVQTEIFNYCILFVIIIAGINIGIQSYPQVANSEFLNILDDSILIIFSLEAILKILSEGIAPYLYWIGPEWKWNCFDFTIVFLSLPFWNGLFGGGSLALLRLVRLMRLAKLIKKVPQLQMIVQGLTGGLSSIGYIMILLFLVFYLFAIAGILFFRDNDPFHFGSLPKALVTCFVCATLDSWSSIMFINSFGCDKYSDVYATFEDMNVTAPSNLLRCDNPKPQFVTSTIYFILLVVMTALVMLSLFIGAVTLSMQDSLDELKETAAEKKKQEKMKKQLAKMFQSQKNTRGSIAQVARRMSRMSFSSFKLNNTSRPESPADSVGLPSVSMSASMSAKYNPIRQIPKLPEFIPEQSEDFEESEKNPPSPFPSSESPPDPQSPPSPDPHLSPKPGVELINFIFSQPSSKSTIKASAAATNPPTSVKSPSLDKKESSSGDFSRSGSRKARNMSRAKSARNEIFTSEVLKQLADETASGESEESKSLSRKLRVALGDQPPSLQDQPKSFELFLSRLQSCQTIPEVILLLAEHSKFISEHPSFVTLVTWVIVLAGINVGAQTEPRIADLPPVSPLLQFLNIIILTVFTIECILKIFGEFPKPWNYFSDHWNKFDFLIVVGSYTPGVGSLLTIFRLLRLLRVLKLVKSLPQLAVIVSALMMGMESIAYIALILFLCFYVFAIMGMMLFRANDPFNFGNLHISMFSLFRCSTLDAWADLMYINVYGCDLYPGGTYSGYPELCTSPHPQGFVAVLYFVCFIVIGAQILLTLFIGVVTTSMEEAQVKQTREYKVERQLTALKVSLDLNDLQITMFKEAFNSLDLDQGGLIELEEMQIGLAAIKDLAEGSNVLEDIEKADPNNNGIDLVSFIVVLCSIPSVRQKTILRKTVKRWLANKRKRGLFFREPRHRPKVVISKQWIDNAWSYFFGPSPQHLQQGVLSSSIDDSAVGGSRVVESSGRRVPSFRNPLSKTPSYQRINGSGSSSSEKSFRSSSRRISLLRHASTTWLPQSIHEVSQASGQSPIPTEPAGEVSSQGGKYRKAESGLIHEMPTFVRDFHDGDAGEGEVEL
jgi:voltage-gated sodium channel